MATSISPVLGIHRTSRPFTTRTDVLSVGTHKAPLAVRFSANPTAEDYFDRLIYAPYHNAVGKKITPKGVMNKITYKYAPGLSHETLSPENRRYLNNNKEKLILEAMNAYHLSKVDEFLGGLTGTHKGARVLVGNGKHEIWGGNFQAEYTRDLTWCVERGAYTHARGEFAKSVDLSLYRNPSQVGKRAAYREQLNRDIKAKIVVMSTNNLGEMVHVCADCHNWLSSPRFFSPDTLMVSLRKEYPEDPKELPTLYVQTLGSQLRRHWQPSLHATGAQINANVDIATIPIQYTARAKHSIGPVSRLENTSKMPPELIAQLEDGKAKIESQFRDTLSRAQYEYNNNPCWELYKTQGYEHKNTGAAVLMTSGHIESASRFEMKRRYVGYPDMFAYQAAYQHEWRQGNFEPRARAVAYVGDDPLFPTPYNIGCFMLNNIGHEDTLILMIQKDKIGQPYLEVASARDYIPQTMQPDTTYKPSVPPWLT